MDEKMGKITISLTRYNEPNWLINETLDAISNQKNITADVLFLDQIDDKDSKEKCKNISNKNITFNYVVIPIISLSYARNEAIKRSETEIVLFIDSDAICEENWAHELCKTLSKSNVGIAGGKITPKWHKKPLLITKSSIVLEQYSVLDFGEKEHECEKVIGANFGINLKILASEAYFDENLGRRGGVLIGGEEVDLCDRANANDIKTYYNGQALVYHQILPERIRYSWVLKRFYFAGIGRSLRGGKPNPTTQKRVLWDYIFIPLILPVYILGYLKAKKHNTIDS